VKVIQVIKDLWNTVRHRDETSKFASDVFIHGVSQVFAQARGVILLPLISIGLSISDYGIWTQTSATANLLLPLLILGLDQAAVRYLPGMQDDKKRFAESFFSMLMVIGLTCILVFFIVWPARSKLSQLILPARSRLSQLILGDGGYVTYIYLLFMLVIGQISFRYLLNYWRLIGKIAHYAVIRMVMDAALLLGIAVIIAGLKFSIFVGIIYWVCLQWLFSFCLLLAILRQIPLLIILI
jgi:O-antigen/teichoic acid export membrane protein